MTKHLSKQTLRRHIPRSILSRYRLGAERVSFRNEAEQIGRGDAGPEACFLIGTPLHANLGDHLISLATRHFFNAVGMHRPIVEVPLEAYRAYGSTIRSGVCPNSIIFVNGGGWMGDMYPDDEATIEHVVNSLDVYKRQHMHQDSTAQAAGSRKIRYASGIDRIGIRLVAFASVDISISSAVKYNVIRLSLIHI